MKWPFHDLFLGDDNRRAAILVTGIAVIGHLLGVIVWPLLSFVPVAVSAAGSFISAVFCLTAYWKKSLSPAASATISLCCLYVALIVVAVNEEYLALMDVHYEPFIGYKIIALVTGVLGPLSPWLRRSYTIIAVCAILPVLQYYLFPPDVQIYLIAPEPWPTLLYALVSLGILIYRHQAHALHEEATRERLDRLSAQRLSMAYLAIRDMTNSPLQSLSLIAPLLRSECRQPNAQELIRQLENGISRLQNLNKVLRKYDGKGDSATNDSFDPEKLI